MRMVSMESHLVTLDTYICFCEMYSNSNGQLSSEHLRGKTYTKSEKLLLYLLLGSKYVIPAQNYACYLFVRSFDMQGMLQKTIKPHKFINMLSRQLRCHIQDSMTKCWKQIVLFVIKTQFNII